MKQLLITALLIIAFLPLKAQKISDVSSLEKAVNLAGQQTKPLLVIVYPPKDHKHSIKSAHLENDIVKKLKSQFVVFETTVEDKDVTPTLSLYKIHELPAFVFMHNTKNVFYHETGASTDKRKYLSMIDKAISMSNEASLVDFEKRYLADQTNNHIIREYINFRKRKGITDNSELIEQFAKNLKPEELNDYQTVLFILEAGPYAWGSAHKATFTNKRIYDSIYRYEPLKKRVEFNNFIIKNTLANAIKTKNVNQAHYAATFAKNSYSNDVKKGARAYHGNMLDYYAAVNDTACYFKSAISFYDNYYMSLSADSIKKAELKRQISFAENNMKGNNQNTKVISKADFEELKKRRPVENERNTTFLVVSENNNGYATTLNNVAWRFYTSGTKNINYLSKAMLWSRRSIDLEPNAAYYDTLAHILYRLGYQTEAIKTQETAIAKAKLQKISFENMQDELKKMKNKSL